MKICIDARMIGTALSGIPRYAHSLISNLADIDKENEYTLLVNPEVPQEFIDNLRNAKNFVTLPVHTKIYSATEQLTIPRILKKNHANLFHSPTYSAPVRQRCPTIMSIHDLIPMAFPKQFGLSHKIYYKNIVRRAAQNASVIITDTNYVKNEICERLDVEKEKIVVIPLGVDERFFYDRPASQSPDHSSAPEGYEKFILGMGNEKPHKNLLSLVKAYKLLIDEHKTDCQLILISRPNEDIQRTIAENGIVQRVTIKHRIRDDELVKLYRYALLFVFPSLAEGFGLPPLEAMACGTPVVSSKATCLPEVLGNAALLTDASNPEELSNAIHTVLTDKSLHASLVARGRERAKQFRWETTARQTLNVYKEVAARLTIASR